MTSFARIYQPAKTAMQSGRAKTKQWRMDFDAQTARRIDPLMGWTSAEDMTASQVRLTFDTRDEAVAFAEKHSIPYRLEEPRASARTVKAYADNFAFQRRKPWTH
ncbi:MAG: ETC complex I subunit [Pseudomonadota bacterium]